MNNDFSKNNDVHRNSINQLEDSKCLIEMIHFNNILPENK